VSRARELSSWPGLSLAAAHLFAASGFAVAQPLFDVLARNAGFLVAHRARAGELAALVGVALFAPPLMAFAPVAAARAVSARAGAALLALAIGVFAFATALAPLHRSEALAPLGATATASIAVGVGALAAIGYARSARIRSFASVLAAAPVVFAALFLFSGPASQLVRGDERSRVAGVLATSEAPIIVVVFDEFGLNALLDADEQIDAIRHPAFAALAQASTWYRDARTVHTSTLQAIPAIATGRLPDPALLPRAADHPDSLFALFAASHAMHVVESQTMLFAADDASEREPGALRSLLEDSALVYLHVLLPPAFAETLPSVRETWGRFAETSDRERQLAVFGRKAVFEGFVDRSARFDAFVDGLAGCERRCLHFLHILLPHRPWELLPSGRRMVPWDSPGLGKQELWGDDAWLVDQAHQQYLLQVRALDAMLGRLVARARELELWDDAAVVVTADHGVGFWPGTSMRWLDEGARLEDVVRVPLFFKAPGQRDARVVSEPVLTVDVLPTLARALDVAIPWRVDGCAIADDAEARDCARAHEADGSRRRVFDRDDRAHSVPDDLPRRRESLERKLALFGEGSASAYAFGPHRELVGVRAADRLAAGESRYSARFDRRALEALARDPDGVSLARISAFLRHADRSAADPDERVAVAFAVDGMVRAVAWARAHAAGSLAVSAIVPEDVLARGSHRIEAFVVEVASDAEHPMLAFAGVLDVEVP